MKTFLLSIKENHFNALVEGEKMHEFRRCFSNIEENFQIVFYVSSPIKAICGFGIFEKVITGDLNKMIKLIKTHKYSSPENLIEYFKGSKKHHALPLKSIKKINNPITLNQLRKLIPKFNPPQSYCSLDTKKYQIIKEKILKN